MAYRQPILPATHPAGPHIVV